MFVKNSKSEWNLRLLVAVAVASGSALAVTADDGGGGVEVRLSEAAAEATERPDSGKWQGVPLASIRLDADPGIGKVPEDRSVGLFSGPEGVAAGQPVRHTPGVLHWAPSNLACQPAYFDDVPLERYGQSVCPVAQPILSGAHFFGMFPIIPYKMGIDRTHDPIYTLGYYRLGGEAPPVRQRLPFELDAAMFEAAAWTGLIFALP